MGKRDGKQGRTCNGGGGIVARTPTPIDKEQVRKLAALGCTIAEIASVIGVSRDTIERRCRSELRTGHEQGNASLRRKQFEIASAGNVTMLIWLGKQRLGQVDRQAITGDGNGPIRHIIEVVRRPRTTGREEVLAAAVADTNGNNGSH
jgi:hypothetical protein